MGELALARESTQKNVYCKDARFLQTSTRSNLQQLLHQALEKKKTIGTRKFSDSQNPNYVQSIIYARAYNRMQFGIFAAYEKGTHQLTIPDDDEAESLTVEQVAPPIREDKKRSEFLDGICYFGAYNNHVMVLGSRSLRVRDLECYLNWILRSARVLAEEDQVALSDQIASATKKRIQTAHVKAIDIGGPLLSPVNASDDERRDVVVKGDDHFELSGLAAGAIRQILGEEKYDGLRLADALDGNIEVSLRIRYLRKTTKKAHQLLDTIALAARNLDEADVTLFLAGGGKVTGKELKLSKTMSIESRDGIPNPDDVFSKMGQWLRSLIENEIIEP